MNLVRSALAENPASTVSSKYQFIDTRTVTQALLDRGMTIDKSIEARVRKPEYQGKQKHQIFFDFPSDTVEQDPLHKFQLRLINSHNASSALSLFLGVYVFVCRNGIVRATQNDQLMRVVHKGVTFDVMKMLDNAITKSQHMQHMIQLMRKYKMSDREIQEFCEYALGLRWKKEDVLFYPSDLLYSRYVREEQKEMNLWNVFNRVQESLMKGFSFYPWKHKNYLEYSKTHRRIPHTVAGLRNITKDLSVNTKLWSRAEELVVA